MTSARSGRGRDPQREVDNCPGVCNTTQDDADGDGIGDACCPGIVPGSDYCISGNSTGHQYSWGGDTSGNGAVEFSEPLELTANTSAFGTDASALASAFASSIVATAIYGASATGNCFTITPPPPGDLYVGTAGTLPSCRITSAGCSYNPNIFCLEPTDSPVLGVGKSGTDTDLDWTSLFTGSIYDVVRGDLGMLRDTGGDFAAATVQCVADNHPSNGVTSSLSPGAGEAFWFLVRGAHCGGGTYDGESPSQAASRDAGIAASGVGCP